MRDGLVAAVHALWAAVGAQPARGDLWSELATALVAAGRAAEAWDAAVRAVELAPRSAASHRAIGSVAAALGDTAQAEAAYRHAALLDPAAEPDAAGGRHAADRADALAAWMVTQIAAPGSGGGHRRAPETEPAPQPNESRHATPDDSSDGHHTLPDQSTGGRRRASGLPTDRSTTPGSGGRRRIPELPTGRPPAPDSEGRRVSELPTDPSTTPGSGGRRRATELLPDRPVAPGSGGRRRAPDDSGPATPVWPEAGSAGGPGTAVWPVGAGTPGRDAAREAGEVRRGRAVGLPAWLGPTGTRGRAEPAGASRAADPATWRPGLITVVRVEWLAGVACFLGLAYPRTAPYTAGLLAGALVVLGAYGRLRWRSTARLRPPEPDRTPGYAAVAAVTTAVVIIPAAMAGALTLARLAAAAAVTAATVAAVLLARTDGEP